MHAALELAGIHSSGTILRGLTALGLGPGLADLSHCEQASVYSCAGALKLQEWGLGLEECGNALVWLCSHQTMQARLWVIGEQDLNQPRGQSVGI